jgi:N-6 DNA Methylase/Type I restriction enzyme R protein N terminus (HSDR_N)
MDKNAMRLALNGLRETLETRNPTEDDVEKGFVDVYRALGYAVSGRDYRNKTRDVSGVPDVILHNSDRSIQVIVELKKPSEMLEAHVGQLAQYLKSLREARWGLLSNGKVWRAYQRDGESIGLVWELTLGDLQQDPSPLEAFERQLIEVTNYTQVAERLKAANREGLAPQGLNDLATNEFLFTFSLKEGSPFAALVGATQDLLLALEDKSDFVRGAYDFWKKVYAREVDADKIPKLWLASKLSIQNNKEGLFRFSYALETAYTLTARLILAKAIQDKDVTHAVIKTNLAERLLEHLKAKRNLRTETLEAESYLEATNDLFDDYARTLFTSIYAKDIFDWWRDYPVAAENPRRNFARAVADLEIALLRFDFKLLEGDLLGEMYQRYFDADTRKALGEFYTPKAVVDFILDQVGYDGSDTLLDPATGSGTFIVSALRRYLKKNANDDPVKTLRGITEEFKLVAFDVNPFAVIMAQIGFASELLPLYGKAIAQNPDFVLRRLPIVRTDSLRKELIEGEQFEQNGQLGFAFEEHEIKATLELPVKIGKEDFLAVTVVFPRLETAKQDGVVNNVREWLQALQGVFASVEVFSQTKDKGQKLPKLETELRHQLSRGCLNSSWTGF